ncbi:TatD family hydrolase [bacterium]|nr:TatD family hydrolase [bacterium]
MLIDTHCHLYFDSFDEDREQVIARMAEASIAAAVVIGIDPDTWQQARGLAEAHPNLYYSIGLHPTSELPAGFSAHEVFGPWFDSGNPPIAVGECGIDLHWDTNTLEAQQPVFRTQLEFARERDLPVIIHTRDANAETLELLQAVPGTRGILHCFNGSPELMAWALAQPQWYISFAGNVSFKKATELHDAARAIPAERLLVETDAPFIAPQAMRGKRNEPAYVRHTFEALAALRNEPIEELEQILLENSRRIFGVDF